MRNNADGYTEVVAMYRGPRRSSQEGGTAPLAWGLGGHRIEVERKKVVRNEPRIAPRRPSDAA